MNTPDPAQDDAPADASVGAPRFTRGRLAGTAALSVLGWAAVVGACSLVGQVSLSETVWRLRMLRLIPASLVGAGLSVAGVALQSLLRNPLASPSILGVSSGAAVGAMLSMILGVGGAFTAGGMGGTTAAAACGGVLTTVVVYLIAQRRGRIDPYTLLLTGVIVTSFNGAIIMLLYLLAPSANVIRDISIWAMGQVREQTRFGAVLVAAGVIVAGWIVLLVRAKAFNVQSLGDEVAGSSGVNVASLRLTTFIAAALMTSAAVALAGPVGFVGLIVPHICRRILGADHRVLLVVAGFAGAAFLAAADTLCRTAVSLRTGELPVGIVTAMTGGPFFIYLLRSRFREATL